jgi:hypothetical protein
MMETTRKSPLQQKHPAGVEILRATQATMLKKARMPGTRATLMKTPETQMTKDTRKI